MFKPSPIDAVQVCEYQDVRSVLLEKREIAFLDVREEDPHAQSHPLFAANFPLSRVELDAYSKLPRRDVQIVTIDEGDVSLAESDAMLAARRLVTLGFSSVAVFAGGVRAWHAAGGELFRDVNVPSKSFGELVESKRHTPSLSAPEVKALIERTTLRWREVTLTSWKALLSTDREIGVRHGELFVASLDPSLR